MIDMRIRDTTAARIEVERAIMLMPEEPLHYLVRALINSSGNSLNEMVLKDVNKAIDVDPTMTEAYLFKATYYTLKGDHKNGCEH
jgi:Tfp pilus assembly protein PilF